MRSELLKAGNRLGTAAIASYTIIRVAENGENIEKSQYRQFELAKQIGDRNDRILSEMRDFKIAFDKSMDEVSKSLKQSKLKTVNDSNLTDHSYSSVLLSTSHFKLRTVESKSEFQIFVSDFEN